MIEIAVLAAHDELMRNAGNEVKDHLDLIELRIPFDIRPDQLHPVLPVPTRERLDVIGIGNVVAFAASARNFTFCDVRLSICVLACSGMGGNFRRVIPIS